MIQNDIELQCTLERIAWFCNVVKQMRVTEMNLQNFRSMSGGFLAEIEKMNKEVIEYLKRHSSEPTSAEAA